MATKTELEKELTETKKVLATCEKDVEAQAKALVALEEKCAKLEKELEKSKGKKASGLTDDQKAELLRLSDFLSKLYRESQHPGVRQDILDWRRLIGAAVA